MNTEGIIASVVPGSIAEECGLLPGDRLVALNGQPLRDIIDYRFHAAESDLELLFRRGSEEHEVSVEKDWDEDLGIEFADSLFDGVRTCRNNCAFCFVKNLPGGLRRSLYIKDDDYRLSFLFGNFVTLSNLGEADLDRISRQRLSPLYVSVHTTDRRLRNRMLGLDAPDILEQIDELGRRGVKVHAQVVLCPGLNDGPQLERTVDHLAARHEVVRSVAVVPVGLTRFSRSPGLRTYQPEEARRVVEQITPIRQRLRQRIGRSFAHLSDEFYVMSGARIPPAAWYDGFPQLDNGVGMVRRLLLDWGNCKRRLPAAVPRPWRVGWICGTSAFPTLRRLADDMNRVSGLRVDLYAVVNEFFGATVTVSGLLTGVDVARVMEGRQVDMWILPRVMLDDRGERTLDGVTLEQMRQSARAPIEVAETSLQLMKLSLYGGVPCAA